jgi:hypothetical protein
VFDPGKFFQGTLTLTGKGKSLIYQEGSSLLSKSCETLKSLPRTNTLAYLAGLSGTKIKKGFISLTLTEGQTSLIVKISNRQGWTASNL